LLDVTRPSTGGAVKREVGGHHHWEEEQRLGKKLEIGQTDKGGQDNEDRSRFVKWNGNGRKKEIVTLSITRKKGANG